MSAHQPGQTVAGKFLLKELIARGGMGSVWKAQHVGLKSDVAVKFIDQAMAKRGNALARFEQEAKAAAAIKSPHVVSVLDYGKDDEGHPYLAMELLDGEELGRRLERTNTLSLDETKALVVQACKALTRAHAAGYVHRDLKPENVFLCVDEEPFTVKILDFGLAKDSSNALQMTGADELLGTPDFMSPEQARGRKVDHRTDLYSLGVLVFKCLTGKLPYEKTAPLPELLISITQREPALASVLRPDLPASVSSWLSRAMQKEPAKRFESAKEMADAFVDACTARRLVVNVPRASAASEDEAQERTARAPASLGEDVTLRGSDPAIAEDRTLRAPSGVSPSPATQSSPGVERPPMQPHMDIGFGEDATMRGEQPKPELPRAASTPPSSTVPSLATGAAPAEVVMPKRVTSPLATTGKPPPSRARSEPAPPSSFRVEKTLPLNADPAAFAAAREAPKRAAATSSDPPPSVPPPSMPPSMPATVPTSGMPLTIKLAIVIVVLAIVAVVSFGFLRH